MTDYVAENPLIVQSDHSLLLEVHSPKSGAARESIAPFAELVKSPEHIHTYRITPLSIWNARAAGMTTEAMTSTLLRYAKYSVPENIAQQIHALGERYGLVIIERDAEGLGLTATLIREDGLEGDVFALIGPKRYDVPWRELEGQGFIAAADCAELRVGQTPAQEMAYALAPRRQQFRIAAENPRKLKLVARLLKQEAGHRILIIGEYLSQVQAVAHKTGFPLLAGKTAQKERERLYEAFRKGEIPGLVLSRVGNFAVDLPDADVLIQISGRYGSRQEEAQRLGRILRPKRDGRRARFYTLVTLRSCEEDFARHRQLFLTEQGYSYRIETGN